MNLGILAFKKVVRVARASSPSPSPCHNSTECLSANILCTCVFNDVHIFTKYFIFQSLFFKSDLLKMHNENTSMMLTRNNTTNKSFIHPIRNRSFVDQKDEPSLARAFGIFTYIIDNPETSVADVLIIERSLEILRYTP